MSHNFLYCKCHLANLPHMNSDQIRRIRADHSQCCIFLQNLKAAEDNAFQKFALVTFIHSIIAVFSFLLYRILWVILNDTKFLFYFLIQRKYPKAIQNSILRKRHKVSSFGEFLFLFSWQSCLKLFEKMFRNLKTA